MVLSLTIGSTRHSLCHLDAELLAWLLGDTINFETLLTDQGWYYDEAGHTLFFSMLDNIHVSLSKGQQTRNISVERRHVTQYLSDRKRVSQLLFCIKYWACVFELALRPACLLNEAAQS